MDEWIEIETKTETAVSFACCQSLVITQTHLGTVGRGLHRVRIPGAGNNEGSWRLAAPPLPRGLFKDIVEVHWYKDTSRGS